MYFVTGASGLIGQSLVASLLQKGEKVKILHRKGSDLSFLNESPHNYTKVEGSLHDSHLLAKELQGIHTIIHTAALVSFQKSDEKELFRTNVEGTSNLVNSAIEVGVNKFIYLSSIAALGRKVNEFNITEDSKWVESNINSNYAKSKYLGELEVWRGFEEGLNGFIVNPSVVLGKGDWSKSSAQLFKFLYTNQQYYPDANLNFVDLKDVHDCIFKLIEANVNHERFIINGGQTHYKDFFTKASKLFGINTNRKPITLNKIKVLYWLDTIRVLFTRKKSLITKETITSLKYTFNYDSNKLLNTIEHNFKSIDDTLKDVIPHYISKYKL